MPGIDFLKNKKVKTKKTRKISYSPELHQSEEEGKKDKSESFSRMKSKPETDPLLDDSTPNITLESDKKKKPSFFSKIFGSKNKKPKVKKEKVELSSPKEKTQTKETMHRLEQKKQTDIFDFDGIVTKKEVKSAAKPEVSRKHPPASLREALRAGEKVKHEKTKKEKKVKKEKIKKIKPEKIKKPKGESFWSKLLSRKHEKTKDAKHEKGEGREKNIKEKHLSPKEKLEVEKIIQEADIKPEKENQDFQDEKIKQDKKKEKPVEPIHETIAKIKNGEIPVSSVDVNLIPKELISELKPEKKFLSLAWIALGALIVSVLVYFALFFFQGFSLNQAAINQQTIDKLKDEIMAFKPLQEKVEVHNKQIDNINLLLDRHIYWTVFFAMLKEYTLPQVQFKSLSGSVTGTFTMTAQAPDYKTITNQIQVFKQADEFIESVEVNSATANLEESEITSVNFSITIQVKPDIFLRHNNE